MLKKSTQDFFLQLNWLFQPSNVSIEDYFKSVHFLLILEYFGLWLILTYISFRL